MCMRPVIVMLYTSVSLEHKPLACHDQAFVHCKQGGGGWTVNSVNSVCPGSAAFLGLADVYLLLNKGSCENISNTEYAFCFDMTSLASLEDSEADGM